METQVRQNPTREQIEKRAYEIYLREGGQDGRADEHWLLAERELLDETRAVQPAAQPVAPKPLTEKSPIASRAAKR